MINPLVYILSFAHILMAASIAQRLFRGKVLLVLACYLIKNTRYQLIIITLKKSPYHQL